MQTLKNLVALIVGMSIGMLLALTMDAKADTTTINYKGQPPPSAISPSMSAFSQDVCAVPVSGAVSGTLFGVSGGSVLKDMNCERIKLAKTLNDLGLKVAAVSILCQDERVFDAMLQSGSPCPINGSIGDAAKRGWYELRPETFKKLYGQTFTIPLVTDEPITTSTTTKGK
jgi:hypothetical protein